MRVTALANLIVDGAPIRIGDHFDWTGSPTELDDLINDDKVRKYVEPVVETPAEVAETDQKEDLALEALAKVLGVESSAGWDAVLELVESQSKLAEGVLETLEEEADPVEFRSRLITIGLEHVDELQRLSGQDLAFQVAGEEAGEPAAKAQGGEAPKESPKQEAPKQDAPKAAAAKPAAKAQGGGATQPTK